MFLITKQFGGSTRAEGSRDPAVGRVVGLECARVDVAQNQVGCPSYVGFARPNCRKRRSHRFAESSPTAPTKAELDLVVADAVEAPDEGRSCDADPSVGSHIANGGYG